ncbi:MAG: ROK family protein [Actinomycetota bacterium]|jgi:predicted NBD/HSP70 family sugar kinase|nr:ROK family protein [Actinomycetota bacterium]
MVSMRTTVKDVRRANRSALLRPLLLNGPSNRVALVQLTGLSSAGVTNVVADLLAEGLVVEAGTEESDGGRPRARLEPNPRIAIIGVDVGETSICIEAFDLQMRVVGKVPLAVHPRDMTAREVIEVVTSGVRALIDSPELVDRFVLGVGVGVPGVVEQGPEGVHAPGLGWQNVSLGPALERAVKLPVLVDNGATTLGQAEMWFGAGRGASHAIVATLAFGVGAAIFANGTLYRGAASSAGEWGHTCIVVGGRRCRCGARGCLEAYVGAEALLAQWRERNPRIKLPRHYDAEQWIKKLVASVDSDPTAAELLHETATYLGVAAANLVNLFNPERIIIGGWLGIRVGKLLLEDIRTTLAEQALAYPAMRVELELGTLGNDATALGASTLVVSNFIESGGELAGRLP